MTGRDLSFSEARRFAWSSYTKRPVLLSSIGLTFVGAWVALELAVVAMHGLGIVPWAAAHLAFLILFAGLEAGLLRIYLALSKGGDARYRDIFSVLGLGPSFLGAQLLYLGLVAFGLVLLVIPGVYLAARYSLFGFAVAGGQRNIIEALRSSSAQTAGVRGRLAAIVAALLLLNILGAALVGVGLLVTVPLSILTLTSVYRQLG